MNKLTCPGLRHDCGRVSPDTQTPCLWVGGKSGTLELRGPGQALFVHHCLAGSPGRLAQVTAGQHSRGGRRHGVPSVGVTLFISIPNRNELYLMLKNCNILVIVKKAWHIFILRLDIM